LNALAPGIGIANRGFISPDKRARNRGALDASKDAQSNVSGGDIEEATPDPIPNSEVKLFGADGTAREAVWESRTLPGFILRTYALLEAPLSQESGASVFCALCGALEAQ
jgi:hypothetical protein